MPTEKFSVSAIVNNDGCFDLQFRKDVRHERTNSPTYYRWKAQFIVTTPKENIKVLEKIKKEIECGEVCVVRDQARLSVQKIDDIYDLVVPFFRKNKLADKKKHDFDLWAKAVEIIKNNKGKAITTWKKTELATLVEIQKSCAKYKVRPRKSKWLDMAKTLTKKS